MLAKTNYMSEKKMFGSIFNGESMTLKIVCSNPRLTQDLSGNADFVLYMKALINLKKINLPNFRELCLGEYQHLIAMFYLIKIKSSKDILGSSMCKVTFGFKYTNAIGTFMINAV